MSGDGSKAPRPRPKLSVRILVLVFIAFVSSVTATVALVVLRETQGANVALAEQAQLLGGCWERRGAGPGGSTVRSRVGCGLPLMCVE